MTEEALFSENSRVSVTAVEKDSPDAKVQVPEVPGGDVQDSLQFKLKDMW